MDLFVQVVLFGACLIFHISKIKPALFHLSFSPYVYLKQKLLTEKSDCTIISSTAVRDYGKCINRSGGDDVEKLCAIVFPSIGDDKNVGMGEVGLYGGVDECDVKELVSS